MMIIVVLLSIILSGCNKIYHWKIEKSIEEIVSIQIATVYGSTVESQICEIDKIHYQEIINDIEALDAKKYGWNLETSFGDSIIITFADNTFDMISLYEPKHAFYEEDGSVNWKITWLFFDEDEFGKLIKKWATP